MIPFQKRVEIRRYYYHNNISKSKLALHFNINRRTVDRILNQSTEEKAPKPVRRSVNTMGAKFYDAFKDDMLLALANSNSKNRITAAYLQQKHVPKDENGQYVYSVRSCARLMERIKKEINTMDKKIPYMELQAMPAEAQIDFGDMDVIINRCECNIALLVLTLPYSNRKLAYALPAQNFECLAYGLERIFMHIGGVPKTIRMDNMSTATKFSGEGSAEDLFTDINGKQRYLTKSFRNLIDHFKFDVEFCNVRAGNEKGSVENAIGFMRTRYFADTRVLNGNSLDEIFGSLNEELMQKNDELMKLKHYRLEDTIADLFELEKSHLLPLPTKPRKWISWGNRAVTDKYGYIQLNGNRYATGLHGGIYVDVGLSWSRVFISHDGKHICDYERSYNSGKRFINWDSMLKIIIIRPNTLKRSSLYAILPENLQYFIRHLIKEDRIKLLEVMSTLLHHNDIYTLIDNMEKCYEYCGDCPVENFICHLRNCYEVKPDNVPAIDSPNTLGPTFNPPSLDEYNKLMSD